jgi:hypothetical protein
MLNGFCKARKNRRICKESAVYCGKFQVMAKGILLKCKPGTDGHSGRLKAEFFYDTEFGLPVE